MLRGLLFSLLVFGLNAQAESHWRLRSHIQEPILEASIGRYKFELKPRSELIIRDSKSKKPLHLDLTEEKIYSLYVVENLLFLVGDNQQLYLLRIPKTRTFIGRRLVRWFIEEENPWFSGKWTNRYQLEILNMHAHMRIGEHDYHIIKHHFTLGADGKNDLILIERIVDEEISVRTLLNESTCQILLRGKI